MYDGDPLKYQEFYRKFYTTVSMKVKDPSLQFQLLLDMVSGKARDRIYWCGHNSSAKVRLRKALQILHDDFGYPDLVELAHLNLIKKREQY